MSAVTQPTIILPLDWQITLFINDIENKLLVNVSKSLERLKESQKKPFVAYLNKSILSGEFYENDTYIDELINKLKEITTKIPIFQRTVNEFSLDNPKLSFEVDTLDTTLTTIKEAIQYYIRVLKFVKYDLNTFNCTDIAQSSYHLDSNISGYINYLNENLNDDSGIEEQFLIVFLINIALLKLDITSDCDESYIKDLNEINDLIEEIGINKYGKFLQREELLQILKEKANFLIYKIRLRKEKKNREVIIKDYETKKSNKYFKPFFELSKHYLGNTITTEKGKVCNYHTRLKKIKNNKDILSFEKLKVEFLAEKSELILTTAFDKIAWFSIEHLFDINNRRIQFDLDRKNDFKKAIADIIERKSNDNTKEETIITEMMTLINQNQKNDSLQILDLKSYIDFMHYLDYFLVFCLKSPLSLSDKSTKELVNSIKTEEDLETEIGKIEKRIDKIEDIYLEALDGFKLATIWCKKSNHKPVFLPYKDCVLDNSAISKTYPKIFLDSTYILPIDIDGEIEKLYGAEGKVNSITSSLKGLINAELYTKWVKGTYEKELENREFKLVGTLAMFISLATFVLWNVKLFEGKLLVPNIITSLFFAMALLLFNSFFHLFIKEDHTPTESQKTWFIVRLWRYFMGSFDNSINVLKTYMTRMVFVGILVIFFIVLMLKYDTLTAIQLGLIDEKKISGIKSVKDSLKVEVYRGKIDSLNILNKNLTNKVDSIGNVLKEKFD